MNDTRNKHKKDVLDFGEDIFFMLLIYIRKD